MQSSDEDCHWEHYSQCKKTIIITLVQLSKEETLGL